MHNSKDKRRIRRLNAAKEALYDTKVALAKAEKRYSKAVQRYFIEASKAPI